MSSLISNATFKWKMDTAGNWTSNNPTPAQGEACLETDTGYWKIGDGSTAWTSLDYQPNPTEVDGKADLSTFSSGWVANSDWTNAEFAIEHSLSTDLSDLIVKFFISTDGTEANAFEIFYTTSSTAGTGITIFQTDDDNIKIQTGTNGLQYITDAGSGSTIDTESYYYKVKIYKLS